MNVEVPDVQECSRRFGAFRICPPALCVAFNDTCPCSESNDFRCAKSVCISTHFRCDEKTDCPGGEDEAACPSMGQLVSKRPEETSMAVIVTLATICALFCIVILVLVARIVIKKRKANTSTDYKSGCTEPFRRSYITADTSSSDDNDKSSRRIIKYYPIVSGSKEDCYIAPCKNVSLEKVTLGPGRQVSRDVIDCENRTKDVKNSAIGNCVKIHVNDVMEKSTKAECVGKYMFKPRLKYTNCNEILFKDKDEKEKMYVINSYKHCAGKSIVPSTLTFDKDPDNFTAKLNNEFLCSSTPRQGARQLMLLNIPAISTDSINNNV